VPPSDELVPELYQLVGAALRDVAQARFMSDVFSRQISFVYEGDGVLRRFPVPRVDIEEAEITLHFAIREVKEDPHRHSSRNAAIGALFDKYSVRMTRAVMWKVRDAVRKAFESTTDGTAAAEAAELEKRFFSDENRELVAGRLLQKFNEAVDSLFEPPDKPRDPKKLGNLVMDFIADDPSVRELWDAVTALQKRYPEADWKYQRDEIDDKTEEQVDALNKAIDKLQHSYPDYKLVIDPSAHALAVPGLPVSSIKIKSTVRNYKWSKVEVDPTDMRNIRTLNPE
jgi:hypothetical protein